MARTSPHLSQHPPHTNAYQRYLLWLGGLVAVPMLVLGVLFGGVAYVNQSGKLTHTLTRTLATTLPPSLYGTLTLGEAKLVLVPQPLPVGLVLYDSKVADISIPELALGFAWQDIIKGNFAPNVVTLTGWEFGAGYDAGRGGWRLDDTSQTLMGLAQSLSGGGDSDGDGAGDGASDTGDTDVADGRYAPLATLPLIRFRLIDSTMTLTHPDLATYAINATLAQVNLDMHRHKGGLVATAGFIDPQLGEAEVKARLNTYGLLTAQVKGDALHSRFILGLWPETFLTTTRNWLRLRKGRGQLHDFDLALAMDLAGESRRPIFMDGTGVITAHQLNYLDGMPMLDNATVDIAFGNTRATPTTTSIDLREGTVAGLDTRGTRIVFVSKEGVADAHLSVTGYGEFGRAMEVLDSPRLNVLHRRGVGAENSTGDFAMNGTIAWRLQKTRPIAREDFAINMTASVAHGVVPYLVEGFGIGLEDGTLDIEYMNGNTLISGRGVLLDAPATLYFNEVEGVGIDLAVHFPESRALAEVMSSRSPLQVEGTASGRFIVDNAPNFKNATAEIMLDLQNSAFHIAPIHVSKPKGEAANLKAVLELQEGQMVHIHDIDFASPMLGAEGEIEFSDGRISGGRFAKVGWSGNRFSDIVLSRSDGDAAGNTTRLKVAATTDVVDLRPLRAATGTAANAPRGLALDIELSARRMIVDERVSLSGQMALALAGDGSGRAEFFGTLYLKDSPFISQAQLIADFGDIGARMYGQGLIGGVEANVTIVADGGTGEANHLILATENAGQVLRTLNITHLIRGGSMEMQVQFPHNTLDHYTAEFDLRDFSVIDAPTAIRALSVLGVVGLYSLLEGDGTYFAYGEAEVDVTPEVQKILFMRASGDALAVELTGLIHPKTREINMSGVLLPIYGLTYLLGYVPLVGQIITGVNNEGILSTRFSITGTLDDPITDVKASSVAPGFLRDIVSPDWINRERIRLFNDETGGSNTSVE